MHKHHTIPSHCLGCGWKQIWLMYIVQLYSGTHCMRVCCTFFSVPWQKNKTIVEMEMEMKPKLDVRVWVVESNSMEVVIAIENCMLKKLCQNEMYPSQKTTIRAKRIATLRSSHTHSHTHWSHNIVLFREIYLFNARERKKWQKEEKRQIVK